MSVAIVTCRNLPEPDFDEKPLLDGFARNGIDAEMLAWDDPASDPERFDLCIIRSTWNYYEDPEGFLRWIDGAAAVTRVMNPPDIIRWNHHKNYLKELELRGIPIVPTRWADKGARVSIADLLHETGWHEIVIKPCISAGSFLTKSFDAEDVRGAQRFLDELVSERDAMIQLCMPSFDEPGERSLIWIDGEWTHAIRKRPRFTGDEERVFADAEADAEERLIGERALAPICDRLLYARLDLVRDNEDRPCISELELIEPSMFFPSCDAAIERFVDAVAQLQRS